MIRAYPAAAYVAAWEALEPHTQNAQACGDIAGEVVAALREHPPHVAADVVLDNWPAGTTRLDRTVLAEVAAVAHDAMFDFRVVAGRPPLPELNTVVLEGGKYIKWTGSAWEETTR